MKKLWGGRFKGELADKAKDYSFSLGEDRYLFLADVKVNLAWAEALKKAKVLTAQEFSKIKKGLAGVEKQFSGEDLSKYARKYEDVHSFVQGELEKKIGAVAKKIHTGKSRNDQVTTGLRLFLKEEIERLEESIKLLQKALVKLSEKGAKVAIPGYTHLQRAQVVTVGHHLLSYVEKFERDKGRLRDALKRIDEMPLGSGALAGVSYKIDRNILAKKLGFKKVMANSMDAVSSRDYVLEVLSAIGILFVTISRLAEDLIMWASREFSFISLDDSYATGSSLMPHKKNPDMLELARGRSGQAVGNLVSFLITIKGLPLTYNRDMQEDKRAVFESLNLVSDTVNVLEGLISTTKINASKCEVSSWDSALMATDLLDYLVFKGIPFKDAHDLVGKIVSYAAKKKKTLPQLGLPDFNQFSKDIEGDVYDIFSPHVSLSKRKTIGSSNPRMVAAAVKKWKKKLAT